MSEIVEKLGRREPIARCRLFHNDHDEIATTVRLLLGIEKAGEGRLSVFELGPDEDWDEALAEPHRISIQVAGNILRTYERELERNHNT
jgi:hypothetical protein